MNISKNIKEKSKKLNNLSIFGLGRWDEEYYLASLYHPLRCMDNVDEGSDGLKYILEDEIDNEMDIYIHVPFCHINCSFCHFYKEIIPRHSPNDLEADYVRGVLKEVDLHSQTIGKRIKPRSIQFGGGTPSALSANGLRSLLDGLDKRFDKTCLEEVKFEFHPDMASDIPAFEDKLRVLRNFGLTTAIVDLEATDPKVLKSISRGNTSKQGFLTLIDVALAEGVSSVASSYLTGLPFETVETFCQTMEFLAAVPNLDAVNIYPLMFKPSDAVFDQRRRNPSIFCSPGEKDLMMMHATEILGASSFHEGPCHFFKRGAHRPKQQFAKAESRTLLGLGPASFGFLNGSQFGLQYMSFPDLKRYLQAVQSGRTGIWRYSSLNRAQKALRRLMFGLNGFMDVPLTHVSEASQCGAPGQLLRTIDALEQLDLLSQTEDSIALTDLGKLRNAEIMFFLSEQEVLKWNQADPEFELLRRYEFFPSISRDNQIRFERFVEQLSQRSMAA